MLSHANSTRQGIDIVLTRDSTGAHANIPQSVIHHSPAGFEFGYGGSGPADLALNILNFFVPADGQPKVTCFQGSCSRFAWDYHQEFKWAFIASLPREGGVIRAAMIREWINQRLRKL